MKIPSRLRHALTSALPLLVLGLVFPSARAAEPVPFPQPAESVPGAPDSVEAAVLAANAALTAAANRLDTDAFFAGIVDSDETRIIQDGKLFKTRAEAMAAVRQGSQGIAKLERRLDDPLVTVLAPGVALLTASGTTALTLQDGRSFGGPFAVSLVFVLRDGRWLLFHGHFSLPNPAR